MCADFVIGKPSLIIIKSENIAGLFAAAYEEMAKLSTAKSAFEHLRIYPYCLLKFTDLHFKPSSMTNCKISNQSAESCIAENANIIENHGSRIIWKLVKFSLCCELLTVEYPVVAGNLPVTKDGPNAKIISPSKIIPIPKV